MPSMDVTQGPTSWWQGGGGGQGSLPPELLDLGKHRGPRGTPACLSQSTGKHAAGGPSQRAPLVGWAAVCRDPPGQASQPGRVMAGTRSLRWPGWGQEWLGQAILQQSCWLVELALSAWNPSSSASLSGLWLGTWVPGLLPAPCRVRIEKASRGPLDSPKVGCCGHTLLASQVAIPHNLCPRSAGCLGRGLCGWPACDRQGPPGSRGRLAEAQTGSTFRRISGELHQQRVLV